MARIDLRISEQGKREIEAAARAAGVSLSEYIRRQLFEVRTQDPSDRLDDLERRLGRLEEMAGL